MGADDLPASAAIAEDFDRIARFVDPARIDEIDPSSRAILERVPPGARSALDVGCGTGALARRLAARVERVTGVDLSSEMIRLAGGASTAFGNVAFEQADFMTWTPPAPFDLVVSVAALHHMPIEPGLARLAAALRPGGALVVVDLFDASGLRDLPYNALSWLSRRVDRKRATPAPAGALARAWDAHEGHDRLVSFDAIRAAAGRLLGGATVERPLGWRYILAWRRPI